MELKVPGTTAISVPTPTITIHPPTPTASTSIINLPSSPSPPPLPPWQKTWTPTTTTYHIYHTGSQDLNLVLYTIPDHSLHAPAFSSECSKRGLWRCITQLCGAKNKQDEEITLDDPTSDPRPPVYFLHSPRIWFRSPPQTLRFGGKGAPVICLIDTSMFWRRLQMNFLVPEKEPGEKEGLWGRWGRWGRRKREEGMEENPVLGVEEKSVGVSLNAPNVIDPRGVLPSWYPLRRFGLPGETGRAYIRSQQQEQEPVPPQDLPEHLTPLEPALSLNWDGWLARDYSFRYSGIDFRWKGTATVRNERKFVGKWSRYNHLKLVAYLPLDPEGGEDEAEMGTLGSELSKKRAFVLAKYTSLWAKRKSGRLLIFERGLEECVGTEEVDRERLRHVLVATALCMIQQEQEKREWLRKIFEFFVGVGVDAGGGGG